MAHPHTTIAAFDLGIKNLSYCVSAFDASGTLTRITRWANLNLLAGGAESQSQTRCTCGGPASWQDVTAVRLYCKRCAKKSAKPVLELGAGAKLDAWKEWGSTHGGLTAAAAKKMRKQDLEVYAGERRLMPYKAPKAKGVTLQEILVGMEACLTAELTHLAIADRIRLENQPSEFAPHMKSIQIMLFTLLDHRLRTEHRWSGQMEFVNASVKTRGTNAGTGKDAKRSRKLAGIERVTQILSERGQREMLTWWQSQAKKDDLADAFLMCVDAVRG